MSAENITKYNINAKWRRNEAYQIANNQPKISIGGSNIENIEENISQYQYRRNMASSAEMAGAGVANIMKWRNGSVGENGWRENGAGYQYQRSGINNGIIEANQ
jgi:hypothetical protein